MIMGQSCGTCRGLAGVVSIRLAPDLRRSGASRWGSSPGQDSRGYASRRTRGWRPRGGVRRAPRTHGEYRELQVQDAENDTIGEAWARGGYPARGQGRSHSARAGYGRSAAVRHRQVVMTVPQASGLCSAHGGGAARRPHPWRQRSTSPSDVAERVSGASGCSAPHTKPLPGAHVCRTGAGLQSPSPIDDRRVTVSGEKRAQGEHGTSTRDFAHGHLLRWPSLWPLPPARASRRRRCSSREHATQPCPTASDTARVAGAWVWCAAQTSMPCDHHFRGARRACAWPPYRPQCSIASWPDWYGPRAPARPGDSPQPGRLCAPRG